MLNIRDNVAQIDLSAIFHNVKLIKESVYPARVMAVVKADAYGHGLERVAHTALMAGADSLGVAIHEEGIALRDFGFTCPILVLGGASLAGCEAAVEYGLEQTVFDVETVRCLEEAARRFRCHAGVHIKLDTGMNRVGVKTESELGNLLSAIADCPNIEVKAAFTHFACADAEDDSATLFQNDRFKAFTGYLQGHGFSGYLHAANSAAALRFKWTHYNCVRPGIAIYGVNPVARSLRREKTDEYGLKHAMTWKTRVAFVKRIEAGEHIGYGWRFKSHRAMTIATLMVGYGDGYKRLTGARDGGEARGQVLISGRRVPIVGRICMDQMMADVSAIPEVHPGDEAVLVGSQGEGFISADELASWSDTIGYETLLSVSPRVPRLYV